MKFGAFIDCFRTDWDKISAWIQTLENGRWHSAWWPDHFMPAARGADRGMPAYEAFASLSFALGMTKRLRMGHLVLGTPTATFSLNNDLKARTNLLGDDCIPSARCFR